MPTLNYLDPWLVNYSYEITPNVGRSEQRGFVKQKRFGQRRIIVASVERRLMGIELPYFEWFVRGVCNDGQLRFTDSYQDENGLQTGEIMIVGGRYNVDTDTRKHLVTCEIQVFK